MYCFFIYILSKGFHLLPTILLLVTKNGNKILMPYSIAISCQLGSFISKTLWSIS